MVTSKDNLIKWVNIIFVLAVGYQSLAVAQTADVGPTLKLNAASLCLLVVLGKPNKPKMLSCFKGNICSVPCRPAVGKTNSCITLLPPSQLVFPHPGQLRPLMTRCPQVYEDWDSYKVNDTLEVYGVLSVSPALSALADGK